MTYQIESLKKLSKVELGSGDRLCRIIAKGGKIGNREIESQGVIIPAVSVSILNALINDDNGREYLCNAVASVQDAIIRKLIEQNKSAVFDNQFDLSAIIAAMQASKLK